MQVIYGVGCGMSGGWWRSQVIRAIMLEDSLCLLHGLWEVAVPGALRPTEIRRNNRCPLRMVVVSFGAGSSPLAGWRSQHNRLHAIPQKDAPIVMQQI